MSEAMTWRGAPTSRWTADETVVLAFGAHPDDVEGFAGGTVAKLALHGARVHVCVATGGEAGIPGEPAHAVSARRLLEAEAASKVLGAASFTALRLQDGLVRNTVDLQLAVVRVARRVGANLLLTHSPADPHPDHANLAVAVREARMVCELGGVGDGEPLPTAPDLVHWDPQHGLGPVPDFWVDVTDTMEVRRAALACHESQLALPDGRSLIEITDVLARLRGIQAGVPYAEGLYRPEETTRPAAGLDRLIRLLAA